MKIASLVLLAFLFACTKKNDLPLELAQAALAKKGDPQSCSFGLNQFNTNFREKVSNIRRPGSNENVSPYSAVILLDFDGHIVSNTSWNLGSDISCGGANLTTDEMQMIFDRVAEDFRPFYVSITSDETIYQQANPYKRMRVVITESWEWYGQAGGTSYLNSFTSGTNTPCFVFSSLLGYSEKKIAEAVSHEVGHTLGLRHQSLYDTNCNTLTEYNSGNGVGELSWAPIMGNSYSRNVTTWHWGTSASSCTAMQDDVAIIRNILETKVDDHANSSNGSTNFSTSVEGIINQSDDIDFFSININTPRKLSAIPFSLGDNVGANINIQLKIYSNRTLVATINDPTFLHTSTILNPGKYFISVESIETELAPRYGMLGKYLLTLE